jgi:hypothetical protein
MSIFRAIAFGVLVSLSVATALFLARLLLGF